MSVSWLMRVISWGRSGDHTPQSQGLKLTGDGDSPTRCPKSHDFCGDGEDGSRWDQLTARAFGAEEPDFKPAVSRST